MIEALTLQRRILAHFSPYPTSKVKRFGFTNEVKIKLLRGAGLDQSRMRDYELDHIIPLGLGGHPRKLANLALPSWEGEHGARRKDSLESRLRSLVCRGEVNLNEAQVCIAVDREACAAKYMGR